MQSGRRLLIEGRIKFTNKGASLSKLNPNPDVKFYGFLFNDLFLLCTEKQKDDSEQPFVFLSAVNTKGLSYQKEGNKNIVVSNGGETWILEFRNSKTRSAWLKCLESVK